MKLIEEERMKRTKMKTTKVWQVMAGLVFLSLLSILPGYNDLRAKETSAFVADTKASEALSSGWEGEAFTAVFFISGKSSEVVQGKWKFSVKPPFPHPISGLKDSYVQTAIGMLLIKMDAAAGMSWLLRAAKQDQIDAVMLIATHYATNQQVKNTVEAERWFRKAMKLGNPEAETMLNDMLAGKPIKTSFKAATGYNCSFSLVK